MLKDAVGSRPKAYHRMDQPEADKGGGVRRALQFSGYFITYAKHCATEVGSAPQSDAKGVVRGPTLGGPGGGNFQISGLYLRQSEPWKRTVVTKRTVVNKRQ
jgi:hypothetical protein